MKKLFMLGTLFIAPAVMAGFNQEQLGGGFTDNHIQNSTMTVAQALKAKDKTVVTLTGKILRQIDEDEFIFNDGASEIKIDVEDRAWAGQNITPNDTITIQGEIDNEAFEKTTLEVFRINKH